MTQKQKLIADFLKRNQGRGFYLDIYDSLAFDFEDDNELNNTLDEMVKSGMLLIKTGEETEYLLPEKKGKK